MSAAVPAQYDRPVYFLISFKLEFSTALPVSPLMVVWGKIIDDKSY